jgi:hypothetical protein
MLSVELNRIIPLAGDPGRCAVVPEGASKYPVLEFAWSLTAVGVTATVLNVSSPAKNVVALRVPVAANFARVTFASAIFAVVIAPSTIFAVVTVPSLGVPIANGVA